MREIDTPVLSNMAKQLPLDLRYRRGLSPVIATVLLVLLSVMAISILAAILVPWARTSLKEAGACVGYSDYFQFDSTFGLNCVRGTDYEVSIRAVGSKELNKSIRGFDLVFEWDDGRSVPYRADRIKNQDCTNGIQMLGTCTPPSTPNFVIPVTREVKSYKVVGSSPVATKVTVHPVVSVEGVVKVCESTHTITLKSCDPN